MLYLIRHGQTEKNRQHLLLGRSDVPLNETGIGEAKAAAARLKNVRFDRVFSSPLLRARQTAEILAPDIPAEIDERLIEMDYGPYEGADLTQLPPEILYFFSDFAHNSAPEGMEQLSSVVGRVGAFLEEIRALEGNILLSVHAISMKGALEYLTPDANGSYWSKNIGNCAVYTVRNGHGRLDVPEEML